MNRIESSPLPTGEIYHILALQDIMEEYPNNPEHVTAMVKQLRNVQAVAAEWE